MSNPDEPNAWITKADSDLLNIRNNLSSDQVPWDTVCFHAQQAAEKMIKAFLVSRHQTIARTHDLVSLLAEASALDSSLASLEADCRLLAPYAVMMRYPGMIGEPDDEEGRGAVAAVEQICDQIRAMISS